MPAREQSDIAPYVEKVLRKHRGPMTFGECATAVYRTTAFEHPHPPKDPNQLANRTIPDLVRRFPNKFVRVDRDKIDLKRTL